MPEVNATPAGIRKKAEKIELEGVSFLTRSGRYAKNFHAAEFAQFTFIDGDKLTIEAADYDAIADVQFKLRPSQPDA